MAEGFMFATGHCFCCDRVFIFHPELVPSYEGSPICDHCIGPINDERRRAGKAVWSIPEGAYPAR